MTGVQTCALPISNAQKFIDLICGGKVPSTVPYGELLNLWMKNLYLNGINLGVPVTHLAIIARESCRDASTGEAYCKTYGKDTSCNEFGYIRANMRTICSMNSTVGAMTFEDFGAMTTASINRKVYGKTQAPSVLEDILKM